MLTNDDFLAGKGFTSMATIHVWKNSPAPAPPYANRNMAAHTIQTGVNFAAAGDTVIVHGDCPGGPCRYVENVVVNKQLSLRGVEWPIIDGGAIDRCVDIISGAAAVTTLDSFEITNGIAAGGTDGGGVRVVETAVRIVNNCIHHNQGRDGGGVYIERKVSLLVAIVESNHIHRNRAQRHGAGVAIAGDELLPQGKPRVSIARNLIELNHSGLGGNLFVHGGGISVFRTTVRIKGNEIRRNRTAGGKEHQGGGIGIFNVDENDSPAPYVRLLYTPWSSIAVSQAIIQYNHIHHNHSRDGGGVSGLWGASIVYRDNTIAENKTTDDGGGVYGSVASHHSFQSGNWIVGKYEPRKRRWYAYYLQFPHRVSGRRRRSGQPCPNRLRRRYLRSQRRARSPVHLARDR